MLTAKIISLVGAGKVVEMISIYDILHLELVNRDKLIQHLEGYISGGMPG